MKMIYFTSSVETIYSLIICHRERFLLLLYAIPLSVIIVDVRYFTDTVEVLHQGSRQGSRVEVPAETPSAPTPGVGPDQMGLHRTNGDERGVRGDGHARHLRWLQPGLYAIRPVPVVVVGNPVAGDIRPAGQYVGPMPSQQYLSTRSHARKRNSGHYRV
jgi:hypothetical protein